MLENLTADIEQFSRGGGFLLKLKIIAVGHSFHLVLVYRCGVALSKLPIFGGLFRVLIEYFIRIVFSSDISLKSKIGPGLVFVHGHDIVIGSNVVIGKNCKLFNGVTLGNKDTEALSNQHPVLGNSVIVSTGAKVLGDILIGDYSVVGANSVLLKDLPSYSVAVGVPARVIKRKNFS